MYHVNEMFFSLQGEGVRAGTPNVFLRFTGCNLRCRLESAPDSPGGFDCDTEFVSGRAMTQQQIVDQAVALWPARSPQRAIVFTGGEPALQLDRPLAQAMRDVGFYTCIETNGSVNVDALGLDWVTVSPKVAEHAVRQRAANEVKYVRAYGQGIPRPACKAEHLLISPAFNGEVVDPEALAWCMQLVKDNPEWRLSVQQHKAWRVR